MKIINFNNIDCMSNFKAGDNIKNYLLPEICFAGRSNVGKSSLINSILNRKKIASTSNKPGHTKKIYLYKIDNTFSLVDLPGYGYANIAKKLTNKLSSLIFSYLSESRMLVKVFLLIDSRHGFKNNDLEFLRMLNMLNLRYQFIFTKSDKSFKKEVSYEKGINYEIQNGLPIIFSSIKTKAGIKQVKSTIINSL